MASPARDGWRPPSANAREESYFPMAETVRKIRRALVGNERHGQTPDESVLPRALCCCAVGRALALQAVRKSARAVANAGAVDGRIARRNTALRVDSGGRALGCVPRRKQPSVRRRNASSGEAVRAPDPPGRWTYQPPARSASERLPADDGGDGCRNSRQT